MKYKSLRVFKKNQPVPNQTQGKLLPKKDLQKPRLQLKFKDAAQQQTPDQATLERVRFSYYNPYKQEDFANARMYWSSGTEIWARLIILLALILNFVMGLLIGRTILGPILEQLKTTNLISALHLSYANSGMVLMAFFSAIIMALVSLPLIISRRAGSVHGWAIFYLFFSCLAFFAVELFLILGLTLASIVNIFQPFANQTYLYYFIVSEFVLTVLWIVGACLLLVKSDDITRRVGVE